MSITLIPILENIILNEIGEGNLPPLEWKQKNKNEFFFFVDINDRMKRVNVYFELFDDYYKQRLLPKKYWGLDNIYNIAFDIDGIDTKYDTTTLKTYLIIMSTIIDMVKNFINDDIDGIYFGVLMGGGSSKSDKKLNFYESILYKKLNEFPNFIAEKYKNGFIVINKYSL